MELIGIILAGGKSARMGEDKGLMPFKGRPMIQHVIDVVKPFVNEIIIIANNSQYKQFGYPVYEDLMKDKGPLAGIYTGLKQTKTVKNLVLSCDAPYVNTKLLELLISNCTDVDVVIPEKDNRTHQLIGVYDKSCIELFKSELDDNQRKLKIAIEKLNYRVVNANHFEDKLFKNINAKNDIEA